MSNMEKICPQPFSGYAGGAKNRKEALMEYREAKGRADASEARLDEYCTAIEDFGLEVPGEAQNVRQILCRNESCTPEQILARAQTEAHRLEKLTQEASNARGRVLTDILRRSKSLAEYRALRWLYVDSAEAQQRAVDVFPPTQGNIS